MVASSPLGFCVEHGRELPPPLGFCAGTDTAPMNAPEGDTVASSPGGGGWGEDEDVAALWVVLACCSGGNWGRRSRNSPMQGAGCRLAPSHPRAAPKDLPWLLGAVRTLASGRGGSREPGLKRQRGVTRRAMEEAAGMLKVLW